VIVKVSRHHTRRSAAANAVNTGRNVRVQESMGLGRTEVFMHAYDSPFSRPALAATATHSNTAGTCRCLVHFINEPAMGERCNIKFYTDERNCRIYAQALAVRAQLSK
jgi:hypothetical protein